MTGSSDRSATAARGTVTSTVIVAVAMIAAIMTKTASLKIKF